MITLRLTELEALDTLKALVEGRKYIKTVHRINDVVEAIEHQLGIGDEKESKPKDRATLK